MKILGRMSSIAVAATLAVGLASCGAEEQNKLTHKLADSLVSQSAKSLGPKVTHTQAKTFSECFIAKIEPYLSDSERKALLQAQTDSEVNAALDKIDAKLVQTKEFGAQKLSEAMLTCTKSAHIELGAK